jgi:hypothetical protein
VKLPLVLSHLAFEEQLSIPSAHSSISGCKIINFPGIPEQDSKVLCFLCCFFSIKNSLFFAKHYARSSVRSAYDASFEYFCH